MKDIYNEFLKSSTQDEFTTEKVNVISNCLLGNYNDNGDYVIPNNIVDELIAVKKVKKSKQNIKRGCQYCPYCQDCQSTHNMV